MRAHGSLHHCGFSGELAEEEHTVGVKVQNCKAGPRDGGM